MAKEKKEKKIPSNKCSNCGMGTTYVRLKTKERVCRNCGFIEKMEAKDGNAS